MSSPNHSLLPPPTAEQRRAAAGQFERANQVVATGNFDYGIGLLLTCCKLDPGMRIDVLDILDDDFAAGILRTRDDLGERRPDPLDEIGATIRIEIEVVVVPGREGRMDHHLANDAARGATEKHSPRPGTGNPPQGHLPTPEEVRDYRTKRASRGFCAAKTPAAQW